MRVASINLYNTSLGGVLQGQERLQKSNEHLITNHKLLTSADGPSDMSKTMFLSSEITLTEQHLKNGLSLENALTLQEGLLSSMLSSAQRARVLGVQSGDGVNESEERESLANELSQVREQMLDLMNSRDANGNSVFAGHQNQLSPYYFDGTRYAYQGDGGITEAKVSASVYIQSNITGFEAFENVTQRLTASANTAGLDVRVLSQGSYDSFHSSNYDATTPANNVYQVQTIAGPPDSYQILDAAANVVDSGEYTDGEPIHFSGLEISLSGGVGSATETFSLNPPDKDNILNTLSTFIEILENPTIRYEEFDMAQRDFLVGLDNAMTKIDLSMGSIGARQNALDSVRDAASSIDLINRKSRASLAEVDIAEAASELSKAELALNTAYSSYSKVSQLTLFNYL